MFLGIVLSYIIERVDVGPKSSLAPKGFVCGVKFSFQNIIMHDKVVRIPRILHFSLENPKNQVFFDMDLIGGWARAHFVANFGQFFCYHSRSCTTL